MPPTGGIRNNPIAHVALPGMPSTPARPRKDRTGLRVRLSRARGLTPRGVLDSPIWLPVVLGEFTVGESADHTDYDTHRAGEFSTPAQGGGRARKLRTTDLEMMALDWDAPWLQWYRHPDGIKRELKKILRSKAPVKLLAQNRLQGGSDGDELRMLVTIRDTQRTLKPGEADARYWQLEIKEFREHSVRRLQSEEGRGYLLPTKHILRDSDTLMELSQRYYGFHWGWRTIADANNIKNWGGETPIVKHDRWKNGDMLTIPKKPTKAGAFLSPRAGSVIESGGGELEDLLHPPGPGEIIA